MRFLIFGSGGIGGFLGAKLAKAGSDVTFVARGEHLKAMRSNGLLVKSQSDDIRLPEVKASSDPREFGDVDVIFFTVKLYDTDNAIQQIKEARLMKDKTVVVSFQNGVDGVEKLKKAFDGRVYAGCTYVPAVIESPGVIKHTGNIKLFNFGLYQEAPQRTDLLVDKHGLGNQIQQWMNRSGLDAQFSPDIQVDLWKKLIILGSFSAMCCLTGGNMSDLVKIPFNRKLYQLGMMEIAHLAVKKGVPLNPEEAVNEMMHFSEFKANPNTRASMLEDLERGKPLELQSLSGYIIQQSAILGLNPHFHSLAFSMLLPYLNGKKAT